MSKDIFIKGISTHNLKDIDISLKTHSINLILGCSGSGKSSLAYDTVAELCSHEFNSMFAEENPEPNYKIKSFENLKVSIPLKQQNHNNNIHSTISTYFGLSQHLIRIFSYLSNRDYSYFVLNKKENICPVCNGVGYVKRLDENRIINYDKTISEIPIKCWNKYKDFYSSILEKWCNDNKINFRKKFLELTPKEKEIILYGESQTKYSIKYKKLNRIASRTTRYYGIMLNIPMLPGFTPNSDAFSDVICEHCHGHKYSQDHELVLIEDKSIGDVLNLNFDDLLLWLRSLNKDKEISFSKDYIYNFVTVANRLNLNYLTLNRNIPSLSGGELQRLRLVKVLNTHLSDLLLVFDEPLSGLGVNEIPSVLNEIISLSNDNTVLIVDHHFDFLTYSKNTITLGKSAGKNGGYIISTEKYLDLQKQPFNLVLNKSSEKHIVVVDNKIYQYNGISITIYKHSANLILGKSGIGKSTILREFLPQHFESYRYLSSKPLLGNLRSHVITYIGIFSAILAIFTKKYNKDKLFFSNTKGAVGACPCCLGTGVLRYGNSDTTILSVTCSECNGTGFNKKLLEYSYKGKTLPDIWNMTIDEAQELFNDNKVIQPILSCAHDLLLGHLVLGQYLSSLSGGENVRIKLLTLASSSSEVLGIDEPFKGLDNVEIFKVISFIKKLTDSGKTVIVADQEQQAFKYFEHKIHINCTDKVLRDS